MSSLRTIAKEISFSSALITAFLIAALGIELVPSTDGPVMIVTNPFSERNAMEVVAATQGSLLSVGRWPWIAIAANTKDPDFRKKLKAEGTLLFLSPLAGGCVTDPVSRGT